MRRILIGLGAAVVLAGCGATTTITATTTVTQTETQTSSVAPASNASSTTSTSTSSSTAGAAESFSGDGFQSVGTITVQHDSTLIWNCPTCVAFAIANLGPGDPNHIVVSTTNGAHSGQTAVVAGSYHQVQVVAGGNWSFRITPG